MRLIDADELMRKLQERDLALCVTEWDIKEAPTIDAVPVVRCGECELHDHCITEDTFRIARIENPFCCAGRKEG